MSAVLFANKTTKLSPVNRVNVCAVFRPAHMLENTFTELVESVVLLVDVFCACRKQEVPKVETKSWGLLLLIINIFFPGIGSIIAGLKGICFIP